MLFRILARSLLPIMVAKVNRLRALTRLFRPSTTSALIYRTFKVVTINCFTVCLSKTFARISASGTKFNKKSTVLRNVLCRKGGSRQDCFDATIQSSICLYFRASINKRASTRRFSMITSRIRLLIRNSRILLVIVRRVTRRSTRFLRNDLYLINVRNSRNMSIVRHVRRRIQIRLITRILRLNFHTTFLNFTTNNIRLHPTTTRLSNDTRTNNRGRNQSITRSRCPFKEPRILAIVVTTRVILRYMFLPGINTNNGTSSRRYIRRRVLPSTSLRRMTKGRRTMISMRCGRR